MFFRVAGRIFPGAACAPGHEEWFFRAREGVHGPYGTQDDAIKALLVFIKYCVETGLTGGRDRDWWTQRK